MKDNGPPIRCCYGHGYWPDLTRPMGPMDAWDGTPTVACPSCGANRNPLGGDGTAKQGPVLDEAPVREKETE